MLSYMLTTLAKANGFDWQIRTAGTYVVEGSAMSARTRDALMALDDVGPHHYSAHRSHQLTSDDVAWADVILASEADHVHFVRRNFPNGTSKTVQLHQFLRAAPIDVTFEEQLHFVALLAPSESLDVADPAGGDQAAYDACAAALWEMAQAFVTVVADEGVA
jgi:protein-tyrosine phosphatase